MSTVNQDELKAIKVLKFEGKESEWERWSEKFVALARARGFAGILLGTEQAPLTPTSLRLTFIAIQVTSSYGAYTVSPAKKTTSAIIEVKIDT